MLLDRWSEFYLVDKVWWYEFYLIDLKMFHWDIYDEIIIMKFFEGFVIIDEGFDCSVIMIMFIF